MYSQYVFTSVISVNSIIVSVEPPQTWLCTFLRSKNQGNQLLSHLVPAAFRFRSMYLSIMLNREHPGILLKEEDALCKMHNETEAGRKGAKKREGLLQTSRFQYIYSKIQIPIGDKLAKSLWSWPKAENKHRRSYNGNLFSTPNEED